AGDRLPAILPGTSRQPNLRAGSRRGGRLRGHDRGNGSAEGGTMTVLALDWNSTRLRAVQGPAGEYPTSVPLEPPSLALPLAISLEHKTPQVGSAALRRCRSAAHQVCHTFLPYLTAPPGQGPRWQAGRHSL